MEILSYFLHNPGAADSLEGVARWRLMDEAIRRNVDDTNTALRWLVAKGFLKESSSPGVGSIFSLNTENVAAAARCLEHWRQG